MGGVRIKDIAAIAGVSVGTVDRVLHARGKVSPQNEALVKKAIQQLGYQPNLVARTLAKRSTFTIAAITPNIAEDHFWQDQRKGFDRGLRDVRDYGMTLDFYEYNDQVKGSLLALSKQVFSRKYDAIIIAPTIHKEGRLFLELCRKNQIPYILINSFVETEGNEQALGYVGQNSAQSGKLAAKLLDISTQAGQPLLILHMEKSANSGSHIIQKEEGFKSYFEMKNKGRECEVQQINDYRLGSLSQSLHNSISKSPNLGGIFVTTSRIHHIVRALNAIDHPELSLVGFDLIEANLEALQNYDRMFLINQNPSLQGYYAIMHLFDKYIQHRSFPKIKYLPLDVITLENVSNYAHIEHRDNVVVG